MEKVLPYDKGVVAQEKFWDCGPASCQVILNSLGVIMSEASLITEIGTTVNGTDNVDWLLRSLNKHTKGQYVTRYAKGGVIKDDQKDQLWADIVRSIDSGFGLAFNFDAPPSNYPKGIKGSVSPSYSGGEVLHYVAGMGYDDNPALRAVWIADPGFSPFGYWVSFDQLCTLIPPKGWAAASVESFPTSKDEMYLAQLGPC